MIKWKTVFITCFICLLPILFGLTVWNDLPDSIAIHFNFNNEPDNFASKGFAVWGLPILMAALQAICCIAGDVSTKKRDERVKLERAMKWILPLITVVLYVATLGYALGWAVDIRKVALLIVGGLLLLIGTGFFKSDHVKKRKI